MLKKYKSEVPVFTGQLFLSWAQWLQGRALDSRPWFESYLMWNHGQLLLFTQQHGYKQRWIFVRAVFVHQLQCCWMPPTSQRSGDGVWLKTSAREVMYSALSSPENWILHYIRTYLFSRLGLLTTSMSIIPFTWPTPQPYSSIANCLHLFIWVYQLIF